MGKYIIVISIMVCGLQTALAQLNVELLHQLVQHSKDEHGRQQTARNRQAVTLANEEVNRQEMGTLKTRYWELHSRFHTLGVVLQGLSMGLESAPIINDIIEQQRRIVGMVGNRPELALLAFEAEREMVHKAVQLGRYLTGLFVSIGDLNQMKASDRRILFGHVIGELRVLAAASRGLANSIQHSSIKRPLDPFGEFVNQDKRIVDNILRRLEDFKP